MINLSRASLLFALAAAAATACSSPHLVGFSPPDASTGETKTVFPTSMGDPFPVDEPVIGPDNGVSQLDVAFDGTVHLVSWLGPRGVSAARFDPDGNLLDKEPLLVAPKAMVNEGGSLIRVLARDGGGFRVFWTGSGLAAGLFSFGPALYAAEIGTNGAPGILQAVARNVPARFALQPADKTFSWMDGIRVIGANASGDALMIRNLGLYADNDRGTTCYTGLQVPMPGLVGEPSYARVGDRDFVAAFAEDPSGMALVVKALPHYVSPLPQDCKVEGIEALRVPFVGDASFVKYGQNVKLIAVAGRALAVWRDWDGSGTTLYGASFQVTGPQTVAASPVVTLAHSDTAWAANDIAAGSEGDVAIVAVRGVAGPSDQADIPLALRVDPVTLASVSTVDGEVSTLSKLARAALGAFSWDGARDLAIMRAGSILGRGAAPAVILPGQPFAEPGIDRFLPGGQNSQRLPRVGCGREQCLVTWQDSREHSRVRGVRVSNRTGKVVDSSSLALGEIILDTGAAAAIDGGFIYATQACGSDSSSGSSVLSLRVVPETGEPSGPRGFPMEGSTCNPSVGVRFVRAQGALYVVVLLRSWPNQLFLFEVAPDGGARPIAHAIPNGRWQYEQVDAVAVGGKILLALQAGDYVTTAFVDPAAATTVVGMQDTLVANMAEPVPAFRVAAPAGRPIFYWTEPSMTSPGFSLRWAPLDDAGKMGAAQTIATERGEMGDLQLDFDDRGLAILYARRTFPSDPYEIVLRRFDPAQPVTQGRGDVRVVATGITTVGHALASAGEGQWLAAYAEGGNSFGNVSVAGAQVSRVFGRFIYEGTERP